MTAISFRTFPLVALSLVAVACSSGGEVDPAEHAAIASLPSSAPATMTGSSLAGEDADDADALNSNSGDGYNKKEACAAAKANCRATLDCAAQFQHAKCLWCWKGGEKAVSCEAECSCKEPNS